jgi:hypothetical protein
MSSSRRRFTPEGERVDPIIEEMVLRILNYGHRAIARHDWQRWTWHLRDVVQPQLDELATLKAKREKKSA